MLKGNVVLVRQDGVTIAAMKSSGLEHTAEVIEKSSATSGTAREFLPGRTTWAVTASWLVSTQQAMQRNIFRVGKTYTLRFGDLSGSAVSNIFAVYGEAICTECKVTAAVGNLVQGSFRFHGTGPLMDASSLPMAADEESEDTKTTN